MKFQNNMGGIDRILRGAVGVGLALLVYVGAITGFWAIAVGVLALALMVTSMLGYCPPYALLGWNTCGCVDRAALVHTDNNDAK
jgi:hypothetical protein